MSAPRNRTAFCVVFGIVFALVYLLAVWKNYALFTYHPAIGEFDWGPQKARGAPAMYFYGWISTSAIAGVVAGFLASLLPARVTDRIPPILTWLAPVCAILILGYMNRKFFL